MSLLEDARRLIRLGPFRNECVAGHTSKAPVTCLFCATPSFDHASDCLWLSMPKIVAVLEAAEAVVDMQFAAWCAHANAINDLAEAMRSED